MFKNRKLEVRLVKDDVRTNAAVTSEEAKLDANDYVQITEQAATRLGKKLLLSVVVVIVTTAIVGVLANAADTALQSSLTNE